MDRMRAALHGGHWPQNPGAANAFFESYHEALFYLLAAGRGIELAAIPEAERSTPDFVTVGTSEERFELKTIDLPVGNAPIARWPNKRLISVSPRRRTRPRLHR